jgi:hypothetical protein
MHNIHFCVMWHFEKYSYHMSQGVYLLSVNSFIQGLSKKTPQFELHIIT